MTVSLQVIYPATGETKFDYDYYLGTHMALVGQAWGPHIANKLVTKGLAGGPDTPAGYHAIATIVFKDQGAFDSAMESAGPLLEDIPNFTDTQPQMLVGEVVG
jgi:uncharacterized protein (TIGR02118 family)